MTISIELPPPESTEIVDLEAMPSNYPDTFELPSLEDRSSIEVGVFAKMIFRKTGSNHAERMWVEVTGWSGGNYTGRLANIPAFIALAQHDSVDFEPRHVAEIKHPWEFPLPL